MVLTSATLVYRNSVSTVRVRGGLLALRRDGLHEMRGTRLPSVNMPTDVSVRPFYMDKLYGAALQPVNWGLGGFDGVVIGNGNGGSNGGGGDGFGRGADEGDGPDGWADEFLSWWFGVLCASTANVLENSAFWGTSCLLAELLAQFLIGGDHLNLARLVRMMAYGALVKGPVVSLFTTFVNRFIGSCFMSNFARLAVDVGPWTWLSTTCWLFMFPLLEGKNVHDAQLNLLTSFQGSVSRSYTMWPWALAAYYFFVPVPLRAAFLLTCDVFWYLHVTTLNMHAHMAEVPRAFAEMLPPDAMLSFGGAALQA